MLTTSPPGADQVVGKDPAQLEQDPLGQREPALDAQVRPPHQHHVPGLIESGVGVSAFSHGRVLLSVARKLLPHAAGRTAFAIPPRTRTHVRQTAPLYRAMGSQKKVAISLGVGQPAVSKIVQGRNANPTAHYAAHIEALELDGRRTDLIRAYIDQTADDARAEYQRRSGASENGGAR